MYLRDKSCLEVASFMLVPDEEDRSVIVLPLPGQVFGIAPMGLIWALILIGNSVFCQDSLPLISACG